MGDISLSPDGFLAAGKLVLQSSPWQNLQRYLADAMNPPASTDTQAQTVLGDLRAAAVNFKSEVLPSANELANTLYNYGQQASATFAAVAQMMSKADGGILKQLFGPLKDSAVGAEADIGKVTTGLAQFHSATRSGGEALAGLLESARKEITLANGAIQLAATELEQRLAAAGLDAKAIESDIRNIQQAASRLAAPKLAGLTLSVAPGVESAQAAAASLKDLGAAWDAVIGQLTQLLDKIANDTEAEFKQEPCFSEFQLTQAKNAWTGVANQAHDFMLNFYVTPK